MVSCQENIGITSGFANAYSIMQQLVLKFQYDFSATLFFVFVCANRFEVSLYVNLLRSVRDASVVPFNQYESMQIHVSTETTNSNVSIVTSITVVCECR